MMKEEVLHYIWLRKYLATKLLLTTENEKIEIHNPGILNLNSGPDFYQAIVKIGRTTWAGTVEIHLKSSDWFKHNHHKDPAYNNVILHVVYECDCRVTNAEGQMIPELEIKPFLPEEVMTKSMRLMQHTTAIPCQNLFLLPENELVNLFLERLCIERLNYKYNLICQALKETCYNREETWFLMVAKHFGGSVNSIAFDLLMANLSFTLLLRYKDDETAILAIMLGVAGFLNREFSDGYLITLKSEFNHLKNKHKLTPLSMEIWKFGGVRPPSFPPVRIIQLASLFASANWATNRLLQCSTIDEMRKMFQTESCQLINIQELLPGNKHYFHVSVNPGEFIINNVIINAAIPFRLYLEKETGNDAIAETLMKWLEELPTEQNHQIKIFPKMGLVIRSAKQSQALLQLKKYYCNFRKCLQCQFGQTIFNQTLNQRSGG